MKQIAVLGMSSFGLHLARRLSELGCEVLALDRDEAVIDQIKGEVAKAVVGDVTDERIVRDLHLAEMDTVALSLGSHFEDTVLAVLHLKEAGAEDLMVKVTRPEHEKILVTMGVKRIVFPERDMALRIGASLHGLNISDYVPLGGNFSVMEIQAREEMIGKTLIQLSFRANYGCQVLAIKRSDPEERTFLPMAESHIHENDQLIVMGPDAELEKLAKS